MEPYYKTWELRDHEFDEEAYDNLMKAWDLGWMARKLIECADKPVFRIKESKAEPGKFCLISRPSRDGLASKVRNTTGPAALNVTYTQKRNDQVEFEVKFVLVPGTNLSALVQTLIDTKGEVPPMKWTRELEGPELLKETQECGGFTVTRFFVPCPDVECEEDEAM